MSRSFSLFASGSVDLSSKVTMATVERWLFFMLCGVRDSR